MRSLGPVFVAVLVLSAGCGGDVAPPASTPAVTTTRAIPRVESLGQELFEERVIGANPGCITCHTREDEITLVGPPLGTLSSRVPELTDAEYIRQSIVDPDAHVVDGFTPGAMPSDWSQLLTEAQIDSLVDYLLTRD